VINILNINEIITKINRLEAVKTVVNIRLDNLYLTTAETLQNAYIGDNSNIELLGVNGLKLDVHIKDIKEKKEMDKSIVIYFDKVQVIFSWN
jgi:hypothetical protein